MTKKSPGRLSVTSTFDAQRDLVWQAWTDPEKLKQWFTPEEELRPKSVKVDLRPGGKFRLQMQKAGGEFFTAAGTYLEIKMPERLVFTWAWEKDGSEPDFGELEPPETLITLEFKTVEKQTELTLTQEKFASDDSRDRHAHGWGSLFGLLARFTKK
jgi:uncharacterized protein YndB with AHSA1/START domain